MRISLVAALSTSLGSLLLTGCVKDEPFKPASPPPEQQEAPLPPEPERAKADIDANGTYTVMGVQSGKCVQFGGGNDGDPAQLATCNGSPVQQFKLEVVPGNYRRLRNVAGNKCLDVASAAKTDGAGILAWPCGDGLNQHWVVADAVGDTLRFWARHSGKVLDVLAEKTTDGSPLGQWFWKGGPNQQFRLKRTDIVAAPAADAAATPTTTTKTKPEATKKSKAKAAPKE